MLKVMLIIMTLANVGPRVAKVWTPITPKPDTEVVRIVTGSRKAFKLYTAKTISGGNGAARSTVQWGLRARAA